jgi:hypothetical protein
VVERNVGIALRERPLADELQRAGLLVDRIGVSLVRLGADRSDEEALVRAHRHRHHDFRGLDLVAGLERAVGLECVGPDVAVIGIRHIDERRRKRGRA